MLIRRPVYAWYRWFRFLEREFRLPVGVFLILIFGGGLIIHLFYEPEPTNVDTLSVTVTDHPHYLESCYGVFLMVFTQNYFRFPREWYIKILFVAVPFIGLGAIANSIVRLGYYVFSRKQKLPEWHKMIASTMRDHVVVVGVGRVGYRVLQGLLALKEQVVAIEKKTDSPLVTEMMDLGVPIILGEARLRKTLEEANVKRARAVILATDDDLTNIDAALTAREIKPGIPVVLRIFDDTVSKKLATAIDMPAISTSATAATALIVAATGRPIYQSFQSGGQKLHVVGLTVAASSRLAGRTVGEVQGVFGVNIVMHQSGGKSVVNPDHEVRIAAGDQIVYIAAHECVARIEAENRSEG